MLDMYLIRRGGEMIVFDKGVKPIKAWVKNKWDIEPGAMTQALNLSQLPFLHKHVALMPDVHQGYGMPIGGVIATDGVVIPNAVGVDIGCGMLACKTSFTNISVENLRSIKQKIQATIPTGFKHRSNDHDLYLQVYKEEFESDLRIGLLPVVRPEIESNNAINQIGTLGSGNHFIEIQKGSDGFIWIMIHSGSRNLGKKVAEYYNKMAVSINEKWYSSVPKAFDLAFIPYDDRNESLYSCYMSEMMMCLKFAAINRRAMLRDIERAMDCPDAMFSEPIESLHNYARMENHFGKNVMVHRKGATSAKAGEIGIIPGSMGTASYVVEGLGNPDSFMSCSHGAGRIMGRNEAKRSLNLANEIDILDKQGILHDIVDASGLDEASGAYKSIADVMDNQKDLVKILVELKPLAVVKG